MIDKKITRTFEIETSEEVMRRIERFLALLHHNSNWGHSGIFAMNLDGDGDDHVKITPTPLHKEEVQAIAYIGHDVEIAGSNGYTCKKTTNTDIIYHVEPSSKGAGIFRNNELIQNVIIEDD